MNFIKGQAPHFQISSGHYWIVPPLTPLPPGGTEIPDWDQAYQEVLVELFSGPAYHAATVTQQLERLGIATNGFSTDSRFVTHIIAQRHLFRLVKARPVSGLGGAPAEPTTPKPKLPEPQNEGEFIPFNPFRAFQSESAANNDNLDFKDLRWSTAQADVDAPVECQFEALEVKEAQDVTLIILEQRPGQETRQLTQLNHRVHTNGSQKVIWHPTSKQLGSLSATPPKETGPYRYFFRVEAGQVKSRNSPPLTLCRTLIVELADIQGSCLADGCRVSLETADGQTLFATLQNGEARFDRVVIGPSKISILDHNHCA